MKRRKFRPKTERPLQKLQKVVSLIALPVLITLFITYVRMESPRPVQIPIAVLAISLTMGLVFVLNKISCALRRNSPVFDTEIIGDLCLGGTFLVSVALPFKRAAQVAGASVRVVFRETAYFGNTGETDFQETEICRQVLPGGVFRPGDVLRGEMRVTLPEIPPALRFANRPDAAHHTSGLQVEVEVLLKGRRALKQVFALDVAHADSTAAPPARATMSEAEAVPLLNVRSG